MSFGLFDGSLLNFVLGDRPSLAAGPHIETLLAGVLADYDVLLAAEGVTGGLLLAASLLRVAGILGRTFAVHGRVHAVLSREPLAVGVLNGLGLLLIQSGDVPLVVAIELLAGQIHVISVLTLAAGAVVRECQAIRLSQIRMATLTLPRQLVLVVQRLVGRLLLVRIHSLEQLLVLVEAEVAALTAASLLLLDYLFVVLHEVGLVFYSSLGPRRTLSVRVVIRALLLARNSLLRLSGRGDGLVAGVSLVQHRGHQALGEVRRLGNLVRARLLVELVPLRLEVGSGTPSRLGALTVGHVLGGVEADEVGGLGFVDVGEVALVHLLVALVRHLLGLHDIVEFANLVLSGVNEVAVYHTLTRVLVDVLRRLGVVSLGLVARQLVLPAYVHHRLVRVAREGAHHSRLGGVAPFVLLGNFLKVLDVALQVFLLLGRVVAALHLIEVIAARQHTRLLVDCLGIELGLGWLLLAGDELGVRLLILVGSLFRRLCVCHFII
mmetsp:Transcript_5126/g.7824  ORF Transcript_5126/g.7824 Transcript_5126/m.7824 type:complete len:493 (-) Transcript_5126:1-1479(-)